MQNFNKIKINFGVPDNGWLLMNFQCEDYQLECIVSDVPINPVLQLLDALILLHKGVPNPDKIIWHLEPYCYYFELEKINNQYNLKVLESESYESPTQLIKTFQGKYKDIILPLYRALKNFDSYSYKTPHWEELDRSRVEELTGLVKG